MHAFLLFVVSPIGLGMPSRSVGRRSSDSRYAKLGTPANLVCQDSVDFEPQSHLATSANLLLLTSTSFFVVPLGAEPGAFADGEWLSPEGVLAHWYQGVSKSQPFLCSKRSSIQAWDFLPELTRTISLSLIDPVVGQQVAGAVPGRVSVALFFL